MVQEPLFVIPDIHGHADKLGSAVARIEAEAGPAARIVFLGDYVDRGPDSRQVLQILFEGLKEGRRWTLLKGNHEAMMLNALEALDADPDARSGWFSEEISGATLASYGVTRHDEAAEIRAAIPAAHLALIRDAALSDVTDDLLLVHAGLRPGVALASQDPDDLIWIREPFLSDRRDHGRLVVHGHTPVTWPEHRGNRVALDGGAGWGRDLHVAMFEGHDCWLLDGAGRHRLQPDQGTRT